MTYCTIADVKLEAGTSLGTVTDDDITNLITRSDEEIVSTLVARGYTAPASDNNLKTASIKLTIAKIKRRQAEELSRPGSLSLGSDISFSVSPETEAKALIAEAYRAIENYILSASASDTYICITPNSDDPYLGMR